MRDVWLVGWLVGISRIIHLDKECLVEVTPLGFSECAGKIERGDVFGDGGLCGGV